MSQETVGEVMSRLLADEDLRVRFAHDRIDTLAELHARGLALTADEIDVFIHSDMRVWFWRMSWGEA
jgi:hypothetical protein